MKPKPGEPGGPAPEPPTPLALRLAGRIVAEGPISFAAFMDAALYDPEHGYYASGQVRLGEEDSDFRTSPEVHPIFGWMLAAQVAEMYEALGRPERYAALVALSTWLPDAVLEGLPENDARSDLSTLLIHGSQDPMVAIENGQDSRTKLESLGIDAAWGEYEMGHEIHQNALRDLIGWLAQGPFAPPEAEAR